MDDATYSPFPRNQAYFLEHPELKLRTRAAERRLQFLDAMDQWLKERRPNSPFEVVVIEELWGRERGFIEYRPCVIASETARASVPAEMTEKTPIRFIGESEAEEMVVASKTVICGRTRHARVPDQESAIVISMLGRNGWNTRVFQDCDLIWPFTKEDPYDAMSQAFNTLCRFAGRAPGLLGPRVSENSQRVEDGE